MKFEAKLKTWLRRNPWLKNAIKKALRIEAVNNQMAELERKLIYQYIQDLHQRIAKLEDHSGLKSKSILNFGDYPKTTFSNVTSQAATSEQMLEPIYAEWCEKLNEKPNFHRKQWEYYYILQALSQNDKLKSGLKGLGFGVGKDPIVAYMVKSGCSVVATDLDPHSAYQAGWAQTNQYSEKLLDLNERSVCKDKDLFKQVTLRNVNMNDIPQDLSKEQFDFVWSACAFEHLGSIENGLQFVINSLKSLKPGGIAIHTTELNISSNDETLTGGDTVIFRKKDFEDLSARLKNMGYSIDLNFYLGNQNLDQYYDVPPYSEFTHLKLQLDRYLTTSYGIIIKKPEILN